MNLSIEAGQLGQVISTAVEDLTFDDVRGLLAEALEEAQVTMPDGSYRWPWLIDVYVDYCVIGLGARYYRVPYTVDDRNNVAFGELQEVQKRYEPVQTDTDVAADMSGDPRVLSFHLRDPESLPAEASADDGLIWKEIFQVSTTFRPQSGKPLVVSDEMIDSLDESFAARVLNNVPITASTHYPDKNGIVPASDTVGFVEKLVKAGKSLFGGLDIKDTQTKEKLELCS